jgi:hypothetical protein
MATSISNISELANVTEKESVKTLSLTEELAKVNKVKYNLSIVYFSVLAVLFATLIW